MHGQRSRSRHCRSTLCRGPIMQREGHRAHVASSGRHESPNVQSFGIKFERIDRDLLCIYETAGKRIYMLKVSKRRPRSQVQGCIMEYTYLHNATNNTRKWRAGKKFDLGLRVHLNLGVYRAHVDNDDSNTQGQRRGGGGSCSPPKENYYINWWADTIYDAWTI